MQLHFNTASPYVRKVRVLMLETGIDQQVELVDCQLTPITPNVGLLPNNPLGKIPTLVLDDGSGLYDSRVICEYLDSLHQGPRMFPDGAARWPALRLQALADGILDAGVITRYETFLRPETLRWPDWIDSQTLKINRSIDNLENAASGFSDVNIGTIASACALGYLDFRYADMNWRSGRPQLASWFDKFAQRLSMTTTAPPAA